MIDRLAGLRIHIEDGSVAAIMHSELLREAPGDMKQARQQGVIFRRHVIQRRDVFLGAHQQMNGSLRTNVVKRNDGVVLIREVRRRFALRDLTEKACLHAREFLLL